jgi:hypothetical protein
MGVQAATVQTGTVLTLSEWSDLATVGACVIGIFTIIALIYQLRLSRKALKAQVSAIEAEVYTSLNSEFFNIIESFDDINKPGITLSELTKKETRAIDRYFYLANTEYILIQQGIIKNEEFVNHWISGIKASIKRKPFLERWETVASSFTLNPKLKKLINDEIQRTP